MVLERRARLDMAGHAITVVDGTGISSEEKCRIFSSTPTRGRIERADRSTIGVDCAKTLIQDVDVEGFAIGVVGIDASAGSDCAHSRITLVDAKVTGNPLDILVGSPPRLVNTTCKTSQNSNGGGTWGVCLND